MLETPSVHIIYHKILSKMTIPLLAASVPAGFPSPAQDHLDIAIDLHRDLIDNPSSTFYGRVSGDSMKDEGIGDGDLMIIDRSIDPKTGHIAVCSVDGDFTLKKIKIESDGCWLIPANPKYKKIKVTEESDFKIWGIVKHVIKSF
jgi:DNA polymerase V